MTINKYFEKIILKFYAIIFLTYLEKTNRHPYFLIIKDTKKKIVNNKIKADEHIIKIICLNINIDKNKYHNFKNK